MSEYDSSRGRQPDPGSAGMITCDGALEGQSSLGHTPGARWEFDASVTAVFPDMLARSIPQYHVMRKAVFDIGMAITPRGGAIVDLGCSRGDGLAPFVVARGARNSYVGVDASGPMLAAARNRFELEILSGLVSIEYMDLREAYPDVQAALTLCVLSLQFIPVECRQAVLDHAFRNTVPGGALILVEKVLGATGDLNETMIDIYHSFKRSSGYTMEEVERKRLALEGVLVPVSAQTNENMLRSAGFSRLECFWRWMNFSGWIAIK